jgi:hypothetical protein
MPKLTFDPARDGFHFANDFVNLTVKLPGFGTIEAAGRCGGMAYAALDYWFSGRLPIPPNRTLPSDGTVMADYIYRRLFETYLVPSAINFVTWTLASDDENWFHKGVTKWSKEGEFPKLKTQLDQGNPQVLGLVKATDLKRIGDDHQVVCYGYEDDGAGNLCAYLWDNRYPDQEVRLETTPENPHWTLSVDSEDWRGLFIQGYAPKRPDFLHDGALLQDKGSQEISMIAGGAKFWITSPDELRAMGFSQDAVKQLGAGSLAYISDYPANGTLLKERSTDQIFVVRGGQKHPISAQAFEAKKFSRDAVRSVPDGALKGLPDGDPIG